MVSPARTAAGLGRIRAVNSPRPVQVRVTEGDVPAAVRTGLPGSGGRWRRVERVMERWRVDEAWWRPQKVGRLYYRLALEGGAVIDLYRDMEDGRWYEQRYGL